ncbi:MAG: hypothetical protein HYR96_04410 [Deltaproteobacteria bacterium]|nr:hypothetical protein [Deltaproteobacteria bacterium]MBI3295422.1 hypothetical protein [Deltaproteobacteria bacterium]
MMRSAICILVLVSSIASARSKPSEEPIECYSGNFQACKSCKTLAAATSKAEPNEGEYFHAAQWNGLYAAYVHNCLAVAEDLLKRGADPSSGGALGSMILTVVDKWPHNNKRVNEKWAALLKKYRANPQKKVGPEDSTPMGLMAMLHSKPDYPDLWARFLK